jgi:hypothetical protein|tara:strand:- start:30 stop:500 length:471 start_codon:yes stop_codon:yes gene_type:complete
VSILQHKKPELLKGYHWHHIKPKHLGGTNDLNNLVLLSPLDHAIAHYVRYKLEKRYGDAWAYNRLMNQAQCEGIRFDVKPNLGKKFSKETNLKKGRSGKDNVMCRPEVREKVFKTIKRKSITLRGKDFNSITEAAKFFDVTRWTIRWWYKKENIGK